MIIGFVGSGSMAAAMARGWAGEVDGMLFTDSGSGPRRRAGRRARRRGGRLQRRAGRARRPGRARGEARAARGGRGGAARARGRSSRCSARPRWSASRGFPGADVLRVMPNVAVEVRSAACSASPARGDGRGPRRCSSCSGTWSSCPTTSSTPPPRSWAARPPTWRWPSRRSPTPAPTAGSTRSWRGSWCVETTAGTAELLRSPSRRRAQGGRLARGQHRGRARGARPRGGPRGLRGGRRASLERMRGADRRWPSTRADVADYVNALFLVYIILIFAQHPDLLDAAHAPTTAAAGGCSTSSPRPTNPYLNLFRRFLPLGRRRRLRARPQPDRRRSSSSSSPQAILVGLIAG